VASDSSDNGEQSDSDGQGPASHGPRECMACRGSGKVISNLGGAPSELACPWCGGTGARDPGVDAQAHWAPREGGADAGAEAGPPEPEPAA
jgi:DnaJ-class molecular chaperone